MSSQYSSPHAFFPTKDLEGTSKAVKNEKHMRTLRSCPEVLIKRAVGRGERSNDSHRLFQIDTPARTPSPEPPCVQQPSYPKNNRLEEIEVMLRSPSSPLYPDSVDAESELTSFVPRFQRRALPRPNDPRRMSNHSTSSINSQEEWVGLAMTGVARNRAVVVLQGELEDQIVENLRTCLQLMGFDDPEILHRPCGKILKEEIESRAASLVDGLVPRSNLLLMICEKDYGYIELDPDFLDKRIYGPVAKYNQRKDEEFIESVKQCNIHEFDSLRFEGVTLHVIVDGVNAHPLKHILRLDLAKDERDVMRSEWKGHNAHQDSNRSILEGGMGHGDVVQFWVSRDMHGYAPFLLLKAMLCICLEEPELPYQILLLRLKTILHKTLETSLSQNPFGQGNARRGIRCMSGIAVHTCAFLIKKLAYYLSERALENQRRQAERDIYDGNYVLSSVDKFDPHLSLKLNWRY